MNIAVLLDEFEWHVYDGGAKWKVIEFLCDPPYDGLSHVFIFHFEDDTYLYPKNYFDKQTKNFTDFAKTGSRAVKSPCSSNPVDICKAFGYTLIKSTKEITNE
jgi:hypothetical protein